MKNYADRGERYPPRLITAFVISTILHIIRKPNEISVLLSIQTLFKDCFETRAYLPPHRLSSRLISSFRGTLSWDIIAWQAFEREGASGTRGGSRARLVTFPFRFERLLRGLDINRSFFLQVTLIQRAIFLPILAFLPLSFGQKFSYFV